MGAKITNQIITIALGLLPLSLILINSFTKIFSNYNPKLKRLTTICTSVQGVLTHGELQVKSIIFDNYKAYFDEEYKILHLENLDSKQDFVIEAKTLQQNPSIEFMAIATTLCHYQKLQNLEEIMSQFFKTCAIDKNRILNECEIIEKIPTNDHKKFSTIVSINKKNQEIFSFTKGNAYNVIEKCSRILIENKKLDFNLNLKRKLKKKIEKLNKNGQKVIGFAYKPLPKKKLNQYSESFTENDLVFIGLIGLGDNINIELEPYLEKLKSLGLKIYITATLQERRAVATGMALKVVNSQYFEAVSGKDLDSFTDQKIAKMLMNKEKDYIFAELEKKDRQRLIDILKDNGEVIALVENSNELKTICRNLEKSQQINTNYKKMAFHCINLKIAESLILITTIIFQAPLPLNIFGIIAIDILFNILLEFSLRQELLSENAEKTKNKHLILNGVFVGIILTLIYFYNLFRFGWYPGESLAISPNVLENSSTIIFNALIFIQILNAFSIRTPLQSLFKSNPFKNIYLTLATVVCVMIFYILNNFPYFQEILNLSSPTSNDIQIIIFVIILTLIFEEIRKLFIRKKLKNVDPNT